MFKLNKLIIIFLNFFIFLNTFLVFKCDENIGQTQSAEEPLQMSVGPITSARAKKFQEALNGLMKEFIWANPTLQEEFGAKSSIWKN